MSSTVLKLPRVDPSDTVVLRGPLWNALADLLERVSRLTVTSPLQISDYCISLQPSPEVLAIQITGVTTANIGGTNTAHSGTNTAYMFLEAGADLGAMDTLPGGLSDAQLGPAIEINGRTPRIEATGAYQLAIRSTDFGSGLSTCLFQAIPGFWTKITGNNFSGGHFTYSWSEVTQDATGGTWSGFTGARTGSATGANPGYNSADPYPVPTNAIVWMGDGPDNGSPPVVRYDFSYGEWGGLFDVTVSQSGGAAGSDGTACTYTYDVITLGGTTIASALSVDKPRLLPVMMSVASVGVAYIDNSGTVKLWDVGEVMADVICASSGSSGSSPGFTGGF